MQRFKDKFALITGVTNGMGYAKPNNPNAYRKTVVIEHHHFGLGDDTTF
jgi:hypothetical protein